MWKSEMRRAYDLARKSEDPSTQNGAIVLSRKHSTHGQSERRDVIGWGFNGPTPGVEMTPEMWERPEKYLWVEHAERAALLTMQWFEPHIMVSPWACCSDCARAVVLAGVRTLVRHKEAMDRACVDLRWKESIAVGDRILQAGGVEIVEWSGKVGISARFDGKQWAA